MDITKTGKAGMDEEGISTSRRGFLKLSVTAALGGGLLLGFGLPVVAAIKDDNDSGVAIRDDNISGASFAPYVCGGSSNSAPAVVYNQPSFASDQVDPNGNLFKKYQRYNYAATHYLQRID